MKKIKIGIIGCGAIGSEIINACRTILKDKISLEALYDIDSEKISPAASGMDREIAANSIDDLIESSDLVIEAASGSISGQVLKKCIDKSKDVMIMSVGGLIDSEDILKKAMDKGVKVYIPSGAICGIDGLKAAKLSGLKSITLTTTKPVRALEGAPYLKEKKIDLDSIKDEEVIFKGNATEAVKAFPQNINVASVLSLAGLGAKNTTVKIVASRKQAKNTHEIEIEGSFGRIKTLSESAPSEKNPKTSKLAIFSAIATLKGITESLRIGT